MDVKIKNEKLQQTKKEQELEQKRLLDEKEKLDAKAELEKKQDNKPANSLFTPREKPLEKPQKITDIKF